MEAVGFQVLVKQGDQYKVFCQNYKVCRKLNELYPRYKEENGKLYRFKEGEEGIFYIPLNFYEKALKMLKKGKCLY